MSIPAELRNARMMVNRGHGDVSDEPDPLHEAAADEIERLDRELEAREKTIERLRQELRAENERLREALERVHQWTEAYPLDIFPEPDWEKANELLSAGGMTVDSVAAGSLRRVVSVIGKITRAALTSTGPAPQNR
jgi:hypothetical protein